MDEKVYKTMNNTGAWSIAVGVISLVVGLACGVMMIVNGALQVYCKCLHCVMMIVNGARLLSSKSKIIF